MASVSKVYQKINSDFQKYMEDPKLGLPSVRLYYGPCASNGFIKHRPQKLTGLIECLKNLNYDVEMIPSSRLNTLQVIIFEKEVQRINGTYLQFNILCEFDRKCENLLIKIKDAVERLYSNTNIVRDKYLLAQASNISTLSDSDSEFTEDITGI